MNQGTLKSAVRRSLAKSILLPSEDGDETVRSRAFGMPKSAAAVEFASVRNGRGQDPTPLRGNGEEKVMAYRNSNDFQLLQVSREAHRLSQMIDSWSKETSIDSRSPFFAEDLLRGAVDLQESLDMLQKLQDASKKLSRANNKHKQEVIGKREGNDYARELGYKGFAVGNYPNRLHEPRLLSDDFSRHCVEELKQVIKESLHKHNVLSSSSEDGKSCSSRSMRYSAGNFSEDKYLERNRVPAEPVCSTSQPKNGKSSNLIAKLMGLEEVPSIKKEEKKQVNVPRPRFDIEMPKARKTQFFSQNNEQRQYRLDELVEAMHYKGLLRKNQVEEKGLEPPFYRTRELEQYGRNLHTADQLPPIVIMKPLHLHYQESNLHQEFPIDKAFAQERIQEIKLVQENNSAGYPFKKSADYNKHNMLAKSQEQKNLKNVDQDITESLPSHETPSSLYHKPQRKKVNMVHKKNADEQKISRLNVKRQEEKGIKATRMTISNPKTSTVLAKSNKEQPVARTNASIVQNQALKPLLRPMPKASVDSSKDKNRLGVKPVRKSAIPTADGPKFNENGTAMRSLKKVNDVPKATGIFDSGNLLQPAKQELKPYPDNMSKDHELFCEAIPRNNRYVGNYKSIEVVPLPDCKKVGGAAGGSGDDLKNIFLSSQSFLSCAKKFFSIDATQNILHQRKSTDMIRKGDSKIFLDVSQELMARKYYQQKLTIHPLMPVQSWSRIAYFSIDKLLEEISDGIRKLTSYSKLDSVVTSEGSLFIRLERELMSKDTAISSGWDIGWDQRICLEEADQVVEEVGRQMLSWLIEEIALELI